MNTKPDSPPQDRTPILIALRSSSWRDELIAELTQNGFEVVSTESGKNAYDAIVDGSFRAIILADDLDDLGGYDVLFQASDILKDSSGGPLALFVHSIRQDDEHLDFIYGRGAHGELQNRAPVRGLVEQIKLRIISHRRSGSRLADNISVLVSPAKGIEIGARLVDISETGAAIVMRGIPEISVGQDVTLGLPIDGEQTVRCRATVRWCRRRNHLFRKKTEIGVEFSFSTDEEKRAIAVLVDNARMAFEAKIYSTSRFTSVGAGLDS